MIKNFFLFYFIPFFICLDFRSFISTISIITLEILQSLLKKPTFTTVTFSETI